MKKFSLNAVASPIDNKLIDIIKSCGIEYPHESLGFFKAKYAKFNEPNLNDVELADSVREQVPQLIGCQANFGHLRQNNIMGTILSSGINDEDEIEIVFSFYKSIYPDEYEYAVELVEKGELHVSFELRVQKEDIEVLKNGVRRLHKVEFDGVGVLLHEDPAYPNAVVYEQATIDKMREQDLVFAHKMNKKPIQQFAGKRWSAKYVNLLPDSSFAVIEPAYLDGETTDKRARHLPIKDVNGNVSDGHFRFALSQVDKIAPITDSILIDELRAKAQEALDNVEISFKSKIEEDIQVEKKANDAILAEFKKNIIAEFGEEAVKDWSDEDFQNDEKIQALKEASKVEEIPTEEVATEVVPVEEVAVEPVEEAKTVIETKTVETYDQNVHKVETDVVVKEDDVVTVVVKKSEEVVYSQAQVDEIKAEYEAKISKKDAEIENVKATAKVVAELRLELGDFAKELTDSDLCNEDKVKIARLTKENESLKKSKNTATEVAVVKATEEVVIDAVVADVTMETGHALVNDDKVDLKAYIRKQYGKK
jgi:hypothetical protein